MATVLLHQHWKIDGRWRPFGQPFYGPDLDTAKLAAAREGERWQAQDPLGRPWHATVPWRG
jgi:hypothetical protein